MPAALKPEELSQLVCWLQRRPEAASQELLVSLVKVCWPGGLSG